nr:hypothetical protein [Pseudomonas juntendi]
MDEATSSLDSLTERFIQDKLDEIMEDKSVVVVAHRLSTVAHLDRILVFDKGGWLRVAVMTSVGGARVMLRSTGAARAHRLAPGPGAAC